MKSIRPYNTFKIDHSVKEIHHINSIDELRIHLSADPKSIILGGGSNVLFTKDIDRQALLIDIKGIEIEQETDQHVVINIGAGEDWHTMVLWALEHNYGGIENLSLIPGKCGAAPMQNIGAYGVELSDVLISVTCMMVANTALLNLSSQACKLGYRDSVFKNEYKGEYVITHMKIKLSKEGHHKINTSYGDIETMLSSIGISEPTIQDVSNAVIAIRSSKLPDPKQLPNAGSFFKNPIIPISNYEEMKWRFPLLPSYPVSDELCKIPAGWLIDQCGWKGVMIGDVGVHNKQALVLVNHGSDDGDKIVQLSRLIQSSVQEKYGIKLETEVNFIK